MEEGGSWSGGGALFAFSCASKEKRGTCASLQGRLAPRAAAPAARRRRLLVSWATWPSLIGRDNIGRLGRGRLQALGGWKGRVDFPLFLPPSSAQQQKEIDKRRRKSEGEAPLRSFVLGG